MTSIRSKILFMIVTALLVSGLVASWATYYSTRAEISSMLDEQLRHTALELIENGENDVSKITFVGQSPQMAIFVQIYDARNNRIYMSRTRMPLPIAETQGFSTFLDENGHEWRQYASAISTRIIQVVQPISVRTDLAEAAAMRIVQPMLVLIAFLAIVVWFVIVQALQPLNHTAKAVQKRSPSSLAPIVIENSPFEVNCLVDAINSLMVRLQSSLSAQQRFASDAAHELRTPLAAIKLQAQLLSRAKTPEDQAKYASRLQQGVARATRLVEQLLTIARLDPDSAVKPMAEVELSSLAQAAKEDLSMAAGNKNISITLDVSQVTVLGMSDALRLMITNLTDNAIRYTPEGGMIEIGVARKGDNALITITDNGPGIAPEERTRVFERFYRGLGTKVSGTGLGLAIVSRIVQMHSGQIVVTDGMPREDGGCGARFEVTLPVSGAGKPRISASA